MKVQTLIIGSGPAGLAVAGRMSERNMEFTIIDASDRIANSWHNHYDRLCLHTVKQLSHLPLVPFPDHYPTYLSKNQLIEYLEQYAKHFDIQPIFEKNVESISQKNGLWEVVIKNGQNILAQSVVLATGVNRNPKIPSWPGQGIFEGTIRHSAEYKNAHEFKGSRTLVVGMGNTGAELALDLSENRVETFISVRSPVSVVPRDLNGRPVQTTSKVLARLPFGFGDWLGSQIRKIYFGDIQKYGLTPSKMHPAVQLRETGKTPVVDIGTINAIKRGKIKVVKDINSFNANGVQLSDGTLLEVDHVVLATGYTADLEHIIPAIDKDLDKYGLPQGPLGENDAQGLYFIGFDNYKLGGILGTINSDSRVITDHIQQKLSNS